MGSACAMMSMSRETEARASDFFHAWRGTGVHLPHFSCNRFLAQPLLPALGLLGSIHITTNAQSRWRAQWQLAAVSHFPLYDPLWQRKREMPHWPKFAGNWPDYVSEPSHASENFFRRIPGGAARKRKIQFPSTQAVQVRKGMGYPE